jgi:hypothetical protein
MSAKRVPWLPVQRLGSRRGQRADASEQAVRRLADLVLGATALAERLQRLAGSAESAAAHRARTARIAQLSAFADWGRAAIGRAVADDGYAEQICGDDGRAPASPHT